MKEQNAGFMISVSVHLMVLLLFGAGMAKKPITGRRINLDFSITETAASGSVEKKREIRQPRKKQTTKAKPPPHHAEPAHSETNAQAIKPIKNEEQLTEAPVEDMPQQEETLEAASGKAEAGAAEHGAKGRDFSYIKMLLQKNLIYPAVARRKGWEGKVVVAFVIACDGNVRDIEVMESSGKTLFDNSAVEVVQRTVPFPRHKAETRIVVPIVYKLREGSV